MKIADNTVSEYGKDLFNPDDNVTREQLSAILYRYAKYKKLDVSKISDLSQFADKDEISSYALESLGRANANGIITGKTSSLIASQGYATRAEAAVMIYRLYNLTAK